MTNLPRTSRLFRPASPLCQAAVAVAIATGCTAALSNPLGAQIVNGQVGIVSAGNQLTVTNTPGAIINWQSFSIGAAETMRFIQQGPHSSVLNRVVGQDPSHILGGLQSNGRVFVINPNGILFGASAQVDVNGLVASSLKLGNEDFLTGKLNFNASTASGDVLNLGTIATPSGGQVYLIAPNVTNSGLITSPQGDVLLAAGQSVKLANASDPGIRVVVSATGDQALNIGTVVAQGGKVGIYGALIRQRGVVSANSAVRGENGHILFKASRDTLLEAGSVTSATGAGQGGRIELLGNRVGLLGNAQVDASGHSGGGTVLVGGDYQGGNAAIQNATRTSMDPDSSIKADALDGGNGGRVIVWSDAATRAYGSISARGGQQGGSGGLIETSGHALDVAGIRVDTGAPKGKTGTWLLDPYDISVRSTANGGSVTLTDFDQFADLPAGLSTVSADTISASNSDVVLQAQHDINFYDTVGIAASGVGLIAQAGNNIRVNNNIATNNGAITLIANDGASGSASGVGSLYVNSSISSNGANINLSGRMVNFQSGPVASSGGDISVTSGGLIALSGGSISAGVGGIVLTAGSAIAQSGGLISGASLNATAASGMGSTVSPLLTSIGALTAVNSDGGGSGISISNTGALHVQRISQSNASTGVVRVDNTGALTVDAGATIANERGATTLISRGPLTVDGMVGSASGAITLEAASTGSSSDTLTVSSSGQILTGGAVLLKAGSTISVLGLVTGSPVTQQANQNVPPAPPPPTISQCIADIALSGCSAVLPTLAVCTSAPASAGCSVVLPTLAQCTTAATLAGCSAVLPTLAVCTSAPATAGCSAVLPKLAACTASPSTAGCSAVLPTLAVCTPAPATAGCSAVLPTLAACTAAPATAGCSAVLPSMAVCTAAPTASGCSAVLPTLPQCTSTPARAGCSAVLPTLAQCSAKSTLAGCSAVLPTLAQCTAAPTLTGCAVVLPPTSTQSPVNTPVAQTTNATVNTTNTATTTVSTPPTPSATYPLNLSKEQMATLQIAAYDRQIQVLGAQINAGPANILAKSAELSSLNRQQATLIGVSAMRYANDQFSAASALTPSQIGALNNLAPRLDPFPANKGQLDSAITAMRVKIDSAGVALQTATLALQFYVAKRNVLLDLKFKLMRKA